MIKRHRVQFTASVAVVAAVAALVTYALSATGYPVHHENLNDGGVWTVSSKFGFFAHVDKPAGAAAGPLLLNGTQLEGDGLDVAQDGSAVVVWDRSTRHLAAADTAQMVNLPGVSAVLPADAQVAIGGGAGHAALAVLDPATGKLWAERVDPAAPVSALTNLVAPAMPIDSKAGTGAEMAVGQDGTIYTVSPAGRLTTIALSGAGFAQPQVSNLGRLKGELSITAVGDTPVVLSGTTLAVAGHRPVHLSDASGAVLQEPGPAAATVLVATPTSLITVALDTGAVTPLERKQLDGNPARPVSLGGCVYGAWATTNDAYLQFCPGDKAPQPGYLRGTSSKQLVIRVNWNQLVVNDPDSGATFTIDGAHAQLVVDWQSLAPPQTQQNAKNKNNKANGVDEQTKPPKAVDDQLRARPGTTTVLHVLDNDSDPAGNIVAIDQVSGLDDKAATLQIAPDEQTISIALPAASTASVHFQYEINDGKGKHASAHVTVTPVSAGTNAPPSLRQGFQARTWSVGASSVIQIPVLGDWRDPDGDPVTLTGAKIGSTPVPVTQDGDIVYTAPPTPPHGPVAIKYTVVDGHGGTSNATVHVAVISAKSTAGAKPVAEPDVVKTVENQPVTIYPLANDLPGADPVSADPQLALASAVRQQAGTTVVSDLRHGTVTFTATHAQTYLLPYAISYGTQTARGQIRVDVGPAPRKAPAIVAMPDTATVRMQQATIVDVLANDYDPAGNVLVVQNATTSDPTSDLQVAVLEGRWLHIVSTGVAPAAPQQVTYTVTDGQSTATGVVRVTELPALTTPDVPIAQTASADVRAGDSVLIPVLDNDIDPGGATLTLVPGSASVASGGGRAVVSANQVRYVAPATARAGTTAVLHYTVTNGAGAEGAGTANGTVLVTVHPAPANAAATDLPPDPPPLTYNVVAGGKITIPIPTSGVDPDGDSVHLVGIAVPPGGGSAGPHLGAVVATTASSITYAAFPYDDDLGTDSFGYEVADRYGKVGTGTIRVGVMPASSLQPPVAVDDSIVGAPGAELAIDVVANDFVEAGDTVGVTVAGDAAGAKVDPKNDHIMLVTAPAAGRTLTIPYRLSDGVGQPSIGMLRVVGQKGWDNPPVAHDDTAQLSSPTATSVVVKVLANDSDPDVGDALRVVKVFDTGATTDGTTVTVPLTAQARTVPYEITDPHGKTAMAVIYVPAVGSGAPYVKKNALIKIASDATSQPVDINDYLVDPAHKTLITTTVNTISVSPGASVRVKAVGATLTFTTSGHYAGPGSITMEVTDGKTASAPGARGYVTIPLLVGTPTAVLNCPAGLGGALNQGAPAVHIDLTRSCHVWLPDGTALADVRFTAKWAKPLSGVGLARSGTGGRALTLSASKGAPGPQQGTVEANVVGSTQPAQALSFNVPPPPVKKSTAKKAKATPPPVPKMTVRAISVAGLKVGESRTIAVTPYAVSQLPHPQIQVLSCTKQSGLDATCTVSGSSVTVTPAASARGVITFTLQVTDDPSDKTRTVPALLTLTVLGKPAVPTGVTADANRTDGGQVQVSWSPSAFDGGAAIDYYVVQWSGGSTGTKNCAASPCVITGLTNGKAYTFEVASHNGADEQSDFSPPSAPATPDAKPNQVTGLTVGTPVGDQALNLSWAAATGTGSAVTHYRLDISNSSGGDAPAPAMLGAVTSYRVTGLVNDDAYSFTVSAENDDGWSVPSAPVSGQSAGTPAPLAAPSVPPEQATVPSHNTTVAITWSPETDSNGPAVKSYTVYKRTGDGGNGSALCTRSANEALTCDDQVANDGTTYEYAVTATNGADLESVPTNWTPFKAIGVPDQVAGVQAVDGSGPGNTAPGMDGKIGVSFTVPAANGAAVTSMQYQLNGGAWTDFGGSWTTGASESETIGGLTNGTQYTVAVRAGNGTYFGPASSPSNAVTPYGMPPTPTVSAANIGTAVNYTWSGSTNGRPVDYWVSIDGAAPVDKGTSPGSLSNQDRGYDFPYSITAYEKDSMGQQSPTSPPASGQTPDVPPPGGVSCSTSVTTITCNWGAASGEGISYRYQWDNGAWATTGSTTASDNFSGDKTPAQHTLIVESQAVSKKTGQELYSSSVSGGAKTDPPPPSWTVVTTAETCPDNMPSGQNWHSGACGANYPGGRGFIPKGASLTVACYYTAYTDQSKAAAWNGYQYWYAYDGSWSVAAGNTNMSTVPADMPAC